MFARPRFLAPDVVYNLATPRGIVCTICSSRFPFLERIFCERLTKANTWLDA